MHPDAGVSTLGYLLGPWGKTGGLGNRKMACLIALVLGERSISRDFVSRNLLLRTLLPAEVLIYWPLGSWTALGGGRQLPQEPWWIISFWEWILPQPLTYYICVYCWTFQHFPFNTLVFNEFFFKKVGNGGKPIFKNTEVDITVLSINSWRSILLASFRFCQVLEWHLVNWNGI